MDIRSCTTVTKRWFSIGLGLLIAGLPLAAPAIEFQPPKRGMPGRREGGGTRDPLACVRGKPSRLMALLPTTNLGLTVTDYPRFFWYMPQTKAKLAEFTLFEVDENLEDRQPVYQTTFNIAGAASGGIASFQLPTQAKMAGLKVGKDYRWTVSLICDPSNRMRDIEIEGWVQRVAVDPKLTKQLTRATVSDRIQLLANNGLWFDTVTTLAAERTAHPTDPALKTSWTELLQSIQLDAIADQPFIPCCQK
ncbi:DUF928 domain-containing protein [Pantanalinema sp. GBBB05]|uniref:DUF928 domain-containing protein n=1 Tax=Pantanalinema sp. GBBB05 TaxID=2604139 RepID=UPI001DCEB04C|nr:DUF928 domain-containing protein [Pantanalinema sp. GBBB05]